MELGKKVIRLPTCSSTNDVLRELAEWGEEEGVAVLAEPGFHHREWGFIFRCCFALPKKALFFLCWLE